MIATDTTKNIAREIALAANELHTLAWKNGTEEENNIAQEIKAETVRLNGLYSENGLSQWRRAHIRTIVALSVKFIKASENNEMKKVARTIARNLISEK